MTDKYSDGPLFVVGMWRSGTSLLYALLNQHPDIGLMYEDDLPLLWPMFIGGKAKQDWLERWEFWNSGPGRHKIEAGDLPSDPSLKEAMEVAYKRAGTTVWGTKSPNYYDSMTELAKMFPRARFIIIWRDLRGICRSVRRASDKPSWFSRAGMIQRTILGYRELKSERDRLVSAGAPVYEIHYEALVQDPQAVMTGVCGFLRIPFDANMCSLKNADRSAVFDHEHHAMVNSSSIEALQNRPEVLADDVRAKIARYTRLWRRTSAGKWPVHGAEDETGQEPSILERLRDRLMYRALRSYDLAIVFLYCYGPISLLRRYRAMKRQARPVSGSVAKETADSNTFAA